MHGKNNLKIKIMHENWRFYFETQYVHEIKYVYKMTKRIRKY